MTAVILQTPDPDMSVASRIARVLSERIVSGVLAPGLPLRQDHVAVEFEASHVPVREAFRKLEAQGLLVSRPRRGVRVSLLDAAEVIEVTEMRAALEGLALRLALPRMTAVDLDVACQALADAEDSDQIAVWEAANQRFHLAITNPCRMRRLMATVADLHRSSARFLFATWKQLDWQPRSDAEHEEILKAAKRGDGERACELLEAHIRAAGHALAQHLDPVRTAFAADVSQERS